MPLGAIAGSVLYLAFVLQQLALTKGVEGDLAPWLVDVLERFQGESLVAAGKWLAGGALTISALGSRFTGTFGRLRVVIDAVPGHRQLLRRSARPAAAPGAHLLPLCIVARPSARRGLRADRDAPHSQGTVISADLLRYLHVQGRLP